ncbi:uncharacterized protein BCR38DRAFT_485357 [Pseudomassariella vexata]|uniref:Uncharacterized protein n=1 Tax=Pseudomassariella vexata TaxID=1141098 RepID=A0A1Y2DY37_9PEZI|nr:uncharacterized protein BCR38DRAFT_485357 [Pseudomassariella vexata]ORY64220.1 hypothetical protein BCR38DRAFT_485357 [Pseudomassariella vexata]
MASRVLFKSTTTAARGAMCSRQSMTQRTIASSAILRHKESAIHNEEDHTEKHKQDLLKKHKDGKAHWKPELASDSEEAIKADRGGGEAEDHQKLQERTKHAANETSKSGTSMRDGL